MGGGGSKNDIVKAVAQNTLQKAVLEQSQQNGQNQGGAPGNQSVRNSQNLPPGALNQQNQQLKDVSGSNQQPFQQQSDNASAYPNGVPSLKLISGLKDSQPALAQVDLAAALRKSLSQKIQQASQNDLALLTQQMKKQSVLSSVSNPQQSFGGGNPVGGNALGGGGTGNSTVRDQQSSQKIALMTELELMEDEASKYIKNSLNELKTDQRMQILFINKMRCQPKAFAYEVLEKFRYRFQQLNGETFYITLDNQRALKASMGIQTLDACLQRLRVAQPLQGDDYIQWNPDLEYAALSHVEDIGPKGLYGHSSTIGLGLYDRLPDLEGRVPGLLAENLSYGSSHPCEQIVLMILLYPEQEQPKPKNLTGALENLIDPNHQLFGIANGKHADSGYLTAAVMCKEFLTEDQLQYWKDYSKGYLDSNFYF